MVSIQVLATPTRGLRRSSSEKPIALNMARAGARSRPSVIPRLRCFGSIGLEDYDNAGGKMKSAERRGPQMVARGSKVTRKSWFSEVTCFRQRSLPACNAGYPDIPGEWALLRDSCSSQLN